MDLPDSRHVQAQSESHKEVKAYNLRDDQGRACKRSKFGFVRASAFEGRESKSGRFRAHAVGHDAAPDAAWCLECMN